MVEARRLPPKPDLDTLNRQSTAASPALSAWVSANAGSGKTYVLATRVIRLLLAGADPAKILCLTYTKTAAAEMKDRVFRRLGDWVTIPADELGEELNKLDGQRPDAERVASARRLFARALETPGGLKIQTIHAFCDALLHRFPLEANVPGHFEQLDEDMIAALIGEARSGMLSHIDGDDGGELATAFRTVMEVGGESGLDGLLDEAVKNRSRLSNFLSHLGTAPDRRAHYLQSFGFARDETSEAIAAQQWPLPEFDDAFVERLLECGTRQGKSLVIKVAQGLGHCAEADPLARFDLLVGTFLKADGQPRTHNMFPAAVLDEIPDYEDRFLAAAVRIASARDRMTLLQQIENTLAALAVVERLLAGYHELKLARGYLDFDDLIGRTANLLARPEVGEWVRYKLDQGIDHILVDEAQDTSPEQWAVIRALADEFFAGDGAREARRTLFAVGDEKQSIYSFQGANPALFAETGDAMRVRIRGAKQNFEEVPLQTSFRSTQDVLSAVDTVFGIGANRQGVAFGTGEIRHRSLRLNEPGRVDVWPLVQEEKADETEHWTDPVDLPSPASVIVAERVAKTIKGWMDRGEILEGTGQPISPGDILILVRSRDAFVATLSRELKNRGVEVAGADRLTMTDHIAVQDLLALARFALQPADDLSLASLLRSPLFDLSEEALFDLAHDRGPSTLAEALEKAAGHDGTLADIHQRLAAWRERSRRLPVFEFYASILSGEGGRERLVARLGPETPDMLDEFMRYALAQERAGLPALQSFVDGLESASPVIKREMDPSRQQVRIMTVHGAKGLEAPVVFLIDRGAAPHSAAKADRFLEVSGAGGETLYLWNATSELKSSVTESAKAEVARKAGEEYRRLLYVGMTRAADRLIVAGYAGTRGGGDDTWRAVVESALREQAIPVSCGEFEALRYQATDSASLPPQAVEGARTAQVETPPEWFSDRVPPESPLPRPLAPSGASGIAIEREDGTASATGAPSLLAAAGDQPPSFAVKRGIVMHRLLQMLPSVPAGDRVASASQYCGRFDRLWTDEDIAEIVSQAMAILDDPQFSDLFGEQAAAEVPVMGTVTLAGNKRAVSGVIDRIAVAGDRVLLVDYKTDALPPADAAAVPGVYLRQMALYRALVSPLYPDKTVEAWLLYTAGPRMVSLPPSLLDAALASITGR